MYLGRIAELADKRTLYAAPLHPYTQALIAAVPIADPPARTAARARRARLAGDIPSALAPAARAAASTPAARSRCRVCREQEPVLAQAAPGHYVACHLAPGAPP